jgi:hypothetical protein
MHRRFRRAGLDRADNGWARLGTLNCKLPRLPIERKSNVVTEEFEAPEYLVKICNNAGRSSNPFILYASAVRGA